MPWARYGGAHHHEMNLAGEDLLFLICFVGKELGGGPHQLFKDVYLSLFYKGILRKGLSSFPANSKPPPTDFKLFNSSNLISIVCPVGHNNNSTKNPQFS